MSINANEERNREIVKLYKSGWFSQEDIGDMFGLNKSSVSRILAGATDDAADLFIRACDDECHGRDCLAKASIETKPYDDEACLAMGRAVFEAITRMEGTTNEFDENKYEEDKRQIAEKEAKAKGQARKETE